MYLLLGPKGVDQGEATSSSGKESREEECSSSPGLEHGGNTESPTHSRGSDYIPSNDEDRADESDVDVTRGFDEEESIRLLERASSIARGEARAFSIL